MTEIGMVRQVRWAYF